MATKTSTNTRRKTTAARRSSSPRSKKKTQPRTMPVWLRNLLAVCIILVFSTGFYWFFIRPYAYRWKPCYGQKGYGVCMPCNYEVHGIDISHYQGEIDWELLTHNREAKFPIHFIFLKATEGGDHGDDTFTQNFGQARKYGFIRGAYHYFIPKTDAHKQADFFIRTVQLAKGDLPPVLDVETTGKQSPQELKAAVKTWLDRVEAHYGVKPILYTSYKFKKRYLSDSIFNAYPYWIAHYYVDSVRYEGKWHFWQHTDVGTVPGIEEEVDLNVFNGTMEELLELTLKTPYIER
ncbi:MAG: glycoside hydrolase family 25 protein [Bacteroides uniformis]|jgi:lysozyme|uniref:glycoside hydrolase family 25 protein n=1 Tax=Bacteroides TaxID=816 RepID=UPI001C3796A6|nr:MULTISPECIES: glycoside hydrolase family 25 protein [Bacteroides]MBS6966648.1 glycoside hydrolase family 25 protein [Bacteroides sp.]MBV4353268.1 glycoside hydrolase family 25 protein [Bacteroides uniformis]MBV4362581.1 glycoside hydrolase family 25 protein [Bacteroides uniformis]MCB6701948.1 glycoside hydrolase family 25 protein [Bacteroides uniformis]MCB7262319.1 glycoside hydrolase family 25 protein [Bacteroides uniformis]